MTHCRYNRAFKVNRGHFGSVPLAGVQFWMARDEGGDFSTTQREWAALTFDPTVTKEQREALVAIVHHLFPVQWKSFTVAPEAAVEWRATTDRAETRLGGGKAAEVVLRRAQGMTDEPVILHNVQYDTAPRNEGFILMPNEVETYRVGDKAFEFKGTNGFMITIDVTSEDGKK